MRALRLTRVIDKCPNIIAYKKTGDSAAHLIPGYGTHPHR